MSLTIILFFKISIFGKKKMIMEKFKIFKIHITYIIGLLILSILGLITVKWYNIPDLVDYITFALTLSTLVLSVLAIIYTLFSNNRFSESIGVMNNISKEILDSSKKLGAITDDLSIKIEEIPEHLKSVEEKTERTHQLLESWRDKEEVIIEEVKTKEENSINCLVDNFLAYSSFNGRCLLYACLLSYKQKKSFIIKDFLDSVDYSYGYFVASSAMELFDYSITENVISITKMNPELEKKIKDVIYEKAKSRDEKKTPEDLIISSWIATIRKTEDYFKEKK
jgi:hypothetical protein